MYGLVNKAVEDLALQLGGPQLWESILSRAGLEAPVWVSMQAYDDALTFLLVEAASDVLGLPQDEVLEAFGRHWILFTGREGYGALLSAMGTTLPEFLANLDAMHSRIALSMPALCPPSFSCEEVDQHTLVVRYYSKRTGLAPMVTGLLTGLGQRLGLVVTATRQPRPADADHDAFVVSHRPADG